MSDTSKRVLANHGGMDALTVKLAREVEALEAERQQWRDVGTLEKNTELARENARLAAELQRFKCSMSDAVDAVQKERDAALVRVAELDALRKALLEQRQQPSGQGTHDPDEPQADAADDLPAR